MQKHFEQTVGARKQTMSTTIELNGKRYDARTGKILPAHEKVTSGKQAYTKPVTKQPGMAVDGFARPRPAKSPAEKARAVHKKTEKSKTLMRTAVKKPVVTQSKVADTPKVVRREAKQFDIDPKRINRAKSVKKSTLVSKFGEPRRAIQPVAASLPVRPEPSAPPLTHHKQEVKASKQAHQHIEDALQKATSHNQAKPEKVTRRGRLSRKLRVSNRTVNIAAASLATVLLAGFIAYQNVPNFSMKVASARAGVEGRLPGYKPSGFGLAGPIKYQDGQITLSYSSTSDERKFAINQRTSQWDSDTLLENYLNPEKKTYQTFQDSGKTIYIYDNNNATWVDGGVWYQIEGNSALNSDQLLRMAASM